MDVSWFLLVLSVAVLISLVLLVIVCLNCWNKGPMVSISQTNESEEYIPSTQFRVIHPHHQTSDIRSTSHLLPPQVVSPSSDLRIPGRRPLTPTDNESIPSYENPTEAYPATDLQDSDIEDPGYIVVIPDDEALARPGASRASTPSSDNQHEYVNLAGEEERQEEDEQEDESNDEQDYQNVDPKNSLTAHSITSALSRSRPSSREAGPAVNEATSESESSDDESGNYVNQPPMIHS